MRDIAFTALIFGSLPFILRRPWIGVLMFAWLGLMTPYRYMFGFAYDFPFAVVVAVVTLIGLLVTKDEVVWDASPVLVLLIVLPAWTCVTTVFALEPGNANERLIDLLKMFLFVHVSAMVLRTRKQVEWMLWVIVVSIGFYGVKGGIFTITSGAAGRVYGPPGTSYLSDNNAISVALVMVIPLMYYLRTVSTVRWVRWGLLVSMALSSMAVLGSYSRGAFLAVAAMLAFLWLKSSQKFLFTVLLVASVPFALGFMPERWTERMNSISNYEEDSSAQGRINTWMTAINLANDRPLVGGGFGYYGPRAFARYAPNPENIHAAHSIYFQMLGEHGYVGLLIFLAIGAFTWLAARRTIALSKGSDDMKWSGQLARAVQVSMVGFAVGGAFVNISYWDLIYYEIVLLLAANRLASQPHDAPATLASHSLALKASSR